MSLEVEMGGLIRLIVLLLILYLVVRWLTQGWKREPPQVKSRRREEPPLFEDRDVMDAKFTEIPSEKKSSEEDGEK